MIVNPDPTVLGNHMKEGKILTIEGHWTLGADLFFIEKIDGNPYSGKKKKHTQVTGLLLWNCLLKEMISLTGVYEEFNSRGFAVYIDL